MAGMCCRCCGVCSHWRMCCSHGLVVLLSLAILAVNCKARCWMANLGSSSGRSSAVQMLCREAPRGVQCLMVCIAVLCMLRSCSAGRWAKGPAHVMHDSAMLQCSCCLRGSWRLACLMRCARRVYLATVLSAKPMWRCCRS